MSSRRKKAAAYFEIGIIKIEIILMKRAPQQKSITMHASYQLMNFLASHLYALFGIDRVLAAIQIVLHSRNKWNGRPDEVHLWAARKKNARAETNAYKRPRADKYT